MNKGKKDFLPIVLGSDENAYGTARLIDEAYAVRSLLLCTRILRPTLYTEICDIKVIEDLDKTEVFVKELYSIIKEKLGEYEKIVVIPCSDYYMYLISENYDSFDGMISNRFISPELIEKLDTKDSFYALCEEYGLDYPKTVVVPKEKRKTPDFIGKLEFPVIVKPENSNSSDYLAVSFEGKKKVYFFHTEEEYFNMVREMDKTEYGGKLIVQEYIKGDDSAMRVINCYSDNDGNVLASVLGQPVLEEYSPKTLGNYAAIISRNDSEIEERIAEFLKKIGYVGYSNFDMKYDAERKKYMLFEINPRLGRSSFFVYASGVNMLKIMIDDVVYGKKCELTHSEKTSLWTSVPKCVLTKYLPNGELKNEVKKLYGTSTKTLFYKKDNSIKRRYVVIRHFLSYIKQFDKYYFKRDE